MLGPKPLEQGFGFVIECLYSCWKFEKTQNLDSSFLKLTVFVGFGSVTTRFGLNFESQCLHLTMEASSSYSAWRVRLLGPEPSAPYS